MLTNLTDKYASEKRKIDRSNFVNRRNYVEFCACLEPPNREFSFLRRKHFKVERLFVVAHVVTFLSSA